MKVVRHAKIKEIVEHNIIETQEELAEELRKQGIEITQATVSRDIKELMLSKVPSGDGRYRYAFPVEKNVLYSQSRMVRMFQDSVTGFDFSENIIIIKTLPGTAHAVASTIDHVKWPRIIGTVAGDDNIIVVVKPTEAVPEVLDKLESILR